MPTSATVRAQQILSYFLRNPRAADNLEGVTRWRLMEETVHRTVDEILPALDWLVAQNFLIEEPVPGSLPVFRLNRDRIAEAEQFVRAAPIAATTATAVRTTAARLSAGGATASSDAVARMVEILNAVLDKLPAPPDGVPKPAVSIAGMTERAVGIGERRGVLQRGALGIVELKGRRLNALVRFHVWGKGATEAEAALAVLSSSVAAQGPDLRKNGFLRIALEATSVADDVPTMGWTIRADYRVLYEFAFEDTDGADSLIARIPVVADLGVTDAPAPETFEITDELMRWDDERALPLVVRGPWRVHGLSALAFDPQPGPGGAVTLTRTFDDATGAPATFGLPEFLTAVTRPDAPERHAQVTFASVGDFLDAFSIADDPLLMGDWNADGQADAYESRVLPITPPLRLESVVDRLEVAYESAAFDQPAVIYLRILRDDRGGTANV